MEWVDFIFTSISLVLNMPFARAMSNFQLGNLILNHCETVIGLFV